MSDNDKYTLDDIIDFSAEQKPADVKTALDNLMISKIHSAIEDKKIEVAKQMFGNASPQDDVEISDETWEDEEETESEDDLDDSDLDSEDDIDFDISDDELEDLLNDLEDSLDDDDVEDDLEVDNLDSEENDNGENA